MSRPPVWETPHLRAAAVGFALTGLVAGGLLWQDRGTLERGNHLYHGGDTLAAIDVYRTRVAGTDPGATALYNLGTALVTLDPGEAGGYLSGALESGDSGVAQRGHYNLGYGLLTGVRSQLAADSAIVLLTSAVANNRRALRLDPEDGNARWNLALSQRLLDSLTHRGLYADREEPAGQDETRIEDLARARSPTGEGISGLEPDQARAAENIGQRFGASQGAREAWATQDPGPVSDADATRLVEAISDGPEQLVRGILWSHRPDVAWWSNQPYPGGSW